MPRSAGTALILVLVATALAGPAWADMHIYSYDPGTPEARALTQTGLSFEFEQHMLGGVRVLRIMQTGDRGSADVRPASDKDLGPGGLKGVLGAERPAGSLYRISEVEDGPAFVNAVCPGAEHAWLTIGSFRRFGDLTMQSIGKDPGAKSARHCATLRFSFRSDWRLPERVPPKVRFVTKVRP